MEIRGDKEIETSGIKDNIIFLFADKNLAA